MIPRIIENKLNTAPQRQAVVVLIGPRQFGKTTLAHAIGEKFDSLYLDLEDLSNQDKLVILDEIHRMPEIFSSLRGIIDRG